MRPIDKLTATDISNMYIWYGIVPDELLHLPKEEQFEAMKYYQKLSKGL